MSFYSEVFGRLYGAESLTRYSAIAFTLWPLSLVRRRLRRMDGEWDDNLSANRSMIQMIS